MLPVFTNNLSQTIAGARSDLTENMEDLIIGTEKRFVSPKDSDQYLERNSKRRMSECTVKILER